MHDGNGSGFASGFLIGATMGALGALLLAPRSGKALRDDLMQEGERLRNRAYAAAAELRERGRHAYGSSEETASGAASDLEEAGGTLRREGPESPIA